MVRPYLGFVVPLLSVPVLAADLVTKRLADAHLDAHVPVGGFVTLALAKNPFGAMSSFAFLPDDARMAFFVAVGVAGVWAMTRMYARLGRRLSARHVALSMVVGGALGNLFDRVRYGRVTDFIDLHATILGRERHWPTFNVADVAILVGIAIMAVSLARRAAPPAELERA